MFGELLSDALSAPFQIAKIPGHLLKEIGSSIDPDDDVAIRSLAESICEVTDMPLDAAIRAIKDSLGN